MQLPSPSAQWPGRGLMAQSVVWTKWCLSAGPGAKTPVAHPCLLLLYSPGSTWVDLPRSSHHRVPGEITSSPLCVSGCAASQDLV